MQSKNYFPKTYREKYSLTLTGVENVLLRMTIIGVILAFQQLAQEALNDVS